MAKKQTTRRLSEIPHDAQDVKDALGRTIALKANPMYIWGYTNGSAENPATYHPYTYKEASRKDRMEAEIKELQQKLANRTEELDDLADRVRALEAQPSGVFLGRKIQDVQQEGQVERREARELVDRANERVSKLAEHVAAVVEKAGQTSMIKAAVWESGPLNSVPEGIDMVFTNTGRPVYRLHHKGGWIFGRKEAESDLRNSIAGLTAPSTSGFPVSRNRP